MIMRYISLNWVHFSELKSIFFLHLNDNELSHIHEGIFNQSHYLAVNSLPAVHLEGNPLLCNCDLNWITQAHGEWISVYGQCALPACLKDHLLTSLTSEQLDCPTLIGRSCSFYLFYWFFPFLIVKYLIFHNR